MSQTTTNLSVTEETLKHITSQQLPSPVMSLKPSRVPNAKERPLRLRGGFVRHIFAFSELMDLMDSDVDISFAAARSSLATLVWSK
jgi:hypothetical protein